jgi:hypothetical protein
MSTFLLFIGADSYWARSICQIKHVGKIPVTARQRADGCETWSLR